MEKPKTTRTRKSTKYVFTLKNINTEKVDQKYGITLLSNLTNIDTNIVNNTTTLIELTETKDTSLDIVSFLDESKRLYQCNISMIDYNTQNNTENMRGYKCYWDRNYFSTVPIGCPISYISSKATKNYHSEVSKDNYVIKENITNYKKTLFLKDKSLFMTKNKATITVDKDEYYFVDGIFCSFNCCRAYIKDNKHNNLYEHSDNLLIKLYKDMNNQSVKNIKINPAPHWRLLKEYGGHLSIEEFRDNFNKCTYDFHGNLNSQVLFKPIGYLYEEKINF